MGLAILTNRESSILKSLIINFVDCGIPIGSQFLSKIYHNRLSSATIRNIMADLEDKGLVTQPYTSAGRIPTDLGYRYYVNGLMIVEKLTRIEKQRIDSDLQNVSEKDVEAILKKSCEVLSKISNYLGVVLSPRFYLGILEKIELVSLSESKLMVVISITSGLVKTITLEVKSSIPANQLESTARILNERLSGLSLRQIRDTFEQRMADVSNVNDELINQLSESVEKIFSVENENLHVKGTHNILSYPEFTNQDKISKLLELFDDQKILIRILNESTKEDDKISITIGQENTDELVCDCSLITAVYRIGDVTGTLGIIGPTRMKYEKVTGLVDYITQKVTDLFS